MKDCKKITHFSISMDIVRAFWEFGWRYCKDQSTNKTRYRPQEVEFGIWFTEVQDVHTRRQIMQVSIKMLKPYCNDTRGCMLSRSSDTPSFFRWKFWIWADFASTLNWVFIIIPPGPKLQITSSSIVSSSSLQPLWTPGFKKCAVCGFKMFLQQRLINFYLGSFDKFFKSWIARVFCLAALQICCSRHIVVHF